jgi:4-amino-4-deoxy-L-arabinose transferase-like glycosyltransferase
MRSGIWNNWVESVVIVVIINRNCFSFSFSALNRLPLSRFWVRGIKVFYNQSSRMTHTPPHSSPSVIGINKVFNKVFNKTFNNALNTVQDSTANTLLITLIGLIAWRLGLMAWLPLADTTEARYGEITRLMLESSNWLMPHANPDEPFFAKPVFSFWLGAISAAVFGANEFGFRFGHCVAMSAAAYGLWLMLDNARRSTKLFALIVLSTCPLAFISAGAVMTDAAQLACVTWAMLAAWRLLRTQTDDIASRSGFWRVMFWAALGVGALTKGIATLVLIGLPLGLFAAVGGWGHFCWVLGRLFALRSRSTWLGLAVFLAIAVPWYALAERSYAGFLQYFFIGEHLMRFIEPGWKGDRYGNAHNERLGTIWVYWTGAVLPWIATFLMLAWQQFKPHNRFVIWRNAPASLRYGWCFLLAPLLFFTVARNIIWTYALTAIPGLVIVLAHWFEAKTPAYTLRLARIMAVLTLLLSVPISWQLHTVTERKSAKGLMQQLSQLQQQKPSQLLRLPIYDADVHPFSSGFYSVYYGLPRAIRIRDAAQLQQTVAGKHAYLLIDHSNLSRLEALPHRTVLSTEQATLVELLGAER